MVKAKLRILKGRREIRLRPESSAEAVTLREIAKFADKEMDTMHIGTRRTAPRGELVITLRGNP